ncbi:MAG: hypothetical protein K6C94_10305 [Candidatus Gastranaerophilales bacterium]|nr:hypothetical protein [Candidatus Gastranaerophilales bacterium]
MKILNKIYNTLIRILSGFVIGKEQRKIFRAKYIKHKKSCTDSPFFNNEVHGKIYYPYYSKSAKQESDEYNMYNKDGQPMRTFFIRDDNMSNCPTWYQSKYFIFDRFNYGLKVHFYSHLAMLEQMGNPDKKFGMFIEPESLVPEDYRIFDNNKGLEKDFDLIFTHTERFLDKFDNARFYSVCAKVWHVMRDENGNLPENWLELKTKNASIVSSDKTLCDLHKLRLQLALKCKRDNIADTFGTFDGGQFTSIDKSLTNYRFSFAIENEIEGYWFTEKILNCFANMTIPIYLGATHIDKFFNPDGIIKISPKDVDNIEQVLKNCTEEEYLSRLDAVKDNYYRSLKFLNSNDWLYETYLQDLV